MNIHNLTEAQKEANRQAVYRENAEWLAAHPTTDEDRAMWELEFKLMNLYLCRPFLHFLLSEHNTSSFFIGLSLQ